MGFGGGGRLQHDRKTGRNKNYAQSKLEDGSTRGNDDWISLCLAIQIRRLPIKCTYQRELYQAITTALPESPHKL
jgi:hypothetical protein